MLVLTSFLFIFLQRVIPLIIITVLVRYVGINLEKIDGKLQVVVDPLVLTQVILDDSYIEIDYICRDGMVNILVLIEDFKDLANISWVQIELSMDD